MCACQHTTVVASVVIVCGRRMPLIFIICITNNSVVKNMTLTSTQIGALAENLVANELMIESSGRLSSFQPIADDDGIDVLIYDKVTANAVPIQIKARTNTINKAGKKERSNTVHFEVRKATLKEDRRALLLCVLLDESLRKTERAWLMKLTALPLITSNRNDKYVIRANRQISSKDKYQQFQCSDMAEVSRRLVEHLESGT